MTNEEFKKTCRDSGAELPRFFNLLEAMQSEIDELRNKLHEVMKMEWASRPLNNLAAPYCNLTNASKEHRDQLHVHEKRLDAQEMINKDDINFRVAVDKSMCAIDKELKDFKKRIDELEVVNKSQFLINASFGKQIKQLEKSDILECKNNQNWLHELEKRIEALEQGRMPDPRADEPKLSPLGEAFASLRKTIYEMEKDKE